MKKVVIIACILFPFLLSGVDARDDFDYSGHKRMRIKVRMGKDVSMGDEKGEMHEMMKIWKITKKLDLSTEQAPKFYATYNSLEKVRVEGRKKLNEAKEKLQDVLNEEKKDEGKVKALVEDIKKIKRENREKGSRLEAEMSRILTPVQEAKLILSKGQQMREGRERFKMMMRKGKMMKGERMKGTRGEKIRGERTESDKELEVLAESLDDEEFLDDEILTELDAELLLEEGGKE